MDCILMIMQEKEIIFSCLHLMQKSMVKQENGLLNTKQKLFPLLLPAPPNHQPVGSRSGTPPTRPQQPAKKSLSDELKALADKAPTTHRRAVNWGDFYHENEKENQAPEDILTESDTDNKHHLRPLLEKWEYDIQQFKQQVLRDLDDLSRKLGIHLSSS
uniref:E4 n=1 Tax=Human papillomavirus type 213 TaxID=2060137 RepID=A0A7G2AB76_9PAPI|nr:E4 [Human papillomavirus type 213]